MWNHWRTGVVQQIFTCAQFSFLPNSVPLNDPLGTRGSIKVFSDLYLCAQSGIEKRRGLFEKKTQSPRKTIKCMKRIISNFSPIFHHFPFFNFLCRFQFLTSTSDIHRRNILSRHYGKTEGLFILKIRQFLILIIK